MFSFIFTRFGKLVPGDSEILKEVANSFHKWDWCLCWKICIPKEVCLCLITVFLLFFGHLVVNYLVLLICFMCISESLLIEISTVQSAPVEQGIDGWVVVAKPKKRNTGSGSCHLFFPSNKGSDYWSVSDYNMYIV